MLVFIRVDGFYTAISFVGEMKPCEIQSKILQVSRVNVIGYPLNPCIYGRYTTRMLRSKYGVNLEYLTKGLWLEYLICATAERSTAFINR